jgi:hypothetical protein
LQTIVKFAIEWWRTNMMLRNSFEFKIESNYIHIVVKVSFLSNSLCFAVRSVFFQYNYESKIMFIMYISEKINFVSTSLF